MPRTTRTRTLAATTVTAWVICALSLTACNGDDEAAEETPADGGRSSAAAPEPTAGPGEGDDADEGGDEGDGGAAAACSDGDVSFSVTSEDAAGEPARHLLLTVTNTGDAECTVHHHPTVQLGADAQTPAPVIEESDPGEPATLAPGDEAYAAVLAGAGGMDEYEVDGIVVGLQGSEPGSDAGEPVTVEVPGGEALYADDGQRVTYWATASGFVLDFVMSQ